MYHGKAVQKKKKNWSNHINLILQNEKNDQRDKKNYKMIKVLILHADILILNLTTEH